MIKKASDIDIQTQQGLNDLKEKVIYYGHYAEQLKVMDLILEIERLRAHDCAQAQEDLEILANITASKLGW